MKTFPQQTRQRIKVIISHTNIDRSLFQLCNTTPWTESAQAAEKPPRVFKCYEQTMKYDPGSPAGQSACFLTPKFTICVAWQEKLKPSQRFLHTLSFATTNDCSEESCVSFTPECCIWGSYPCLNVSFEPIWWFSVTLGSLSVFSGPLLSLGVITRLHYGLQWFMAHERPFPILLSYK